MKRCIVDSNASEIIIQRDSVNRVSIRIGRSQFSMENRLLFVTFRLKSSSRLILLAPKKRKGGNREGTVRFHKSSVKGSVKRVINRVNLRRKVRGFKAC